MNVRAAVTVLGAVVVMSVAQAQTPRQVSSSRTTALYAAVGAELIQYDVDVKTATLTRRGSVTLPANVQYAWRHPSSPYFYVAWSNGGASYVGARGGTAGPAGTRHGVTTFRIDASGALQEKGQMASLPSRPIHLSVDMRGTHVLIAYNDPSGVTVHRIESDGTVGAEVKQPAPLDVGIYAHQIRVDPSNTMAFLVTRGNGPTPGHPEDPGGLKMFSYEDGVLANRGAVAPGGGINFQPRHLDFHPSRPWIFLSLERQHKIQMYERLTDGTLGAAAYTKDTLADPARARPTQTASTVHVHPSGRFVYIANRATDTTSFEGKTVFAGGENSIAVFAIDQDTGEPTLIQSIDTRGVQPRTFALDPSGRVLVAGNQSALAVRDGTVVRDVAAGLATFRVGDNGKLEFVRKYDTATTAPAVTLFWMGIVPLP